jgi:hypothetical protein
MSNGNSQSSLLLQRPDTIDQKPGPSPFATVTHVPVDVSNNSGINSQP